MTHEQRAAIQQVLSALSQFQFGPIVEAAPFVGLVSLTPAQHEALVELAKAKS